MAEPTAPAAKRTPATKPTAAKRTPAKPKPAPTAPVDENVSTFVLIPAGGTKTYEKFVPPEGSGCTGTFYAAKGTKTVKVRLER